MSEENQQEVQQAENASVEIDAKAIEEEMLRQAEARAQDPTEMCATMYQMYLPFFERSLPKLSTRGLRRVLNYLIKYPFEQDDIKAANQFEKDFMNLAGSLAEAKYVMIMSQYADAAVELYEASQAPLTEQEEAEVKKELDIE